MTVARIGAVIAVMLAFMPLARGQSAEAEALFRDGDRLMGEGKTQEACDAFDGSNRIEPRAGTLIRLAECREKNHQLASAWSAYSDALVRAKDPRKREIAEAGVKAIEPRLSKLTIDVAARVDGMVITRNGKRVDEALLGRATPIDGGLQTIVATAPGFAATTIKVEVPEERGNVVAKVPALEKSGGEPPDVVEKPVPPSPVPATHDVDAAGTFTAKRKAAVMLAAVGVFSLAGGAYLGASAKAREHDAFELCPDPAVPCARSADATTMLDSAHSRALYANVAFGVGGVAVVGATVLWLIGAPHREADRVSWTPRVSANSVGVAVGGRF